MSVKNVVTTLSVRNIEKTLVFYRDRDDRPWQLIWNKHTAAS